MKFRYNIIKIERKSVIRGCMTTNLKELRKSKGFSQKELGNILNVTERAIYNYERGIRQIIIKQVLLLTELYQESEKDIILAQINSSVRPIK